MNKEVIIDASGGHELTVEVEVLPEPERMHYLSKAPDSITESGGPSLGDIEWYTDVAEASTTYSRSELDTMPTNVLASFCETVVPVALGQEDVLGPTEPRADSWMVVSR
jgi:hypothetical protein